MSSHLEDLERKMCDCYEAQSLQFSIVLDAAGGLADDFEQGRSTDAVMQRIGAALKCVKALEEANVDTKDAWDRAGRPTSERLGSALHRVKEQLRQLIGEIDGTVSSAQRARERLAPTLETHSRAIQMQDAYSSAASQTPRSM